MIEKILKDIEIVRELGNTDLPVKEQEEKFKQKTKKSKRTFFRYRKILNLKTNEIKNLNISKANMGEKNGLWKGENVGYTPLHNWVRRRKPKPEFCENCGVKPPYDLANISGKYKRDINDFEWLCRKCHMKKDGRMNNLLRNEKRKHQGNLIYCTKCKSFKTKENFVKDKFRWDNLNKWCKECVKKKQKDKKGLCKNCGNTKNYYAKGLCYLCYQKEYGKQYRLKNK